MAYKQVNSLDADTTIAIGGFNKKLKKDNPLSAEGHYLGAKVVDSAKSKSGKALLHIFQTAKGNLGVWGKTDMDRKLAQVTPGTMTRVSFKTMKAVPTGEMYIFSVEVDGDNTIEVNLQDTATTTDDGDDLNGGGQEQEEESYNNDHEPDEEQQALEAAENKARVAALLNRNKTSNSKRPA